MEKICGRFYMFFLMVILCSCSNVSAIENEIVMTEGMMIEAENAAGIINVEIGKGLERIYRWNSKKVEVELMRRDKRWNGSLGIYSPGGSSDVHTVVEEGQQHFCSEQEALEWLRWEGERMQYVFTSDGLVVGWYEDKDPNSSSIALSVQVWQFYINGKKPSKLLGAKDSSVKVSFRTGSISQPVQIGKIQPSSPKEINGRLYSGKSIDIMNEKDISADRVENAISKGQVEEKGKHLTCYFIDDKYHVLWVKLDKKGRVVLVGN